MAGWCYRYIGKADVQMPLFTFTEGPQVADSRLAHRNIMVSCRGAMLNGGNRPKPAVRAASRELVEEGFGFFEVGGVEALGEPVVDRG